MRRDVEDRVRRRAKERCEYCQMPQSAFDFTFPIDHVIARQHGGKTVLSNLALACLRCNRHKGPNLSGIDPRSGQVVPLYHPRRDTWSDHFEWQGPRLIGKTPSGRATIRVLTINDKEPVEIRAALIALGGFPPEGG